MASNEISERFAAAAWVQCGSDGGEGAGVVSAAQLRFRSAVGFKNRIITTTDIIGRPLVVLELDRELNRRETAVFVERLGTVGYNPDTRSSYPNVGPAVPTSVPQPIAQPCHLAWFGPDLSAPLWMPFGMSGGAGTLVPDGFDLDVYNAIAVLLPSITDAGRSGDFTVAVFEHPRPDALDQPIRAELPAAPPPEDPIMSLNPIARWRMDHFNEQDTEGGIQLVNFPGMVGTEGALDQNGSTLGLPGEQANFNDQVAWNPSQISMVNAPSPGPSYFDFLASGECDVFIVFAVDNPLAEDLVSHPQFTISIDPAGTENVNLQVGTAGAILNHNLTPLGMGDTSVAQLLFFHAETPQAIDWEFGCTSPGNANGAWASPPPEPSSAAPTFAATGCFYAEILMFDRALTAPERGQVVTYFIDRYAVPAP